MFRAFSSDPEIEVHFYPGSGIWAAVNNSERPKTTTCFDLQKRPHELSLGPGELKWFNL